MGLGPTALADDPENFSVELEVVRRRTNERRSYVEPRQVLGLRLNHYHRFEHRGRGCASWSDDRRAMRNHAQRTVRSRCSLTRQGVVHVHGLHESEAGHHQCEKYRGPSLERRTIELALEAHSGTVNTVYPNKTRSAKPSQQKIAAFCPINRLAGQPLNRR